MTFAKPKQTKPSFTDLQSDTVSRSEIDYQPANIGRITNRQDVIDPFINRPNPVPAPRRNNLTRTDTIRSGFHRAGNTIRKSGRRVKQKASTARQSIRRAAAKPIVPYSAIDRSHGQAIRPKRPRINNNAHYGDTAGWISIVIKIFM